MTQHEPKRKVRVVHKYDVDTLGAPFKVTLLDSVTLSKDPATGAEIVEIPDLVGLISVVVKTRVCHTRKLTGPEIKFVRHALGVRAKLLADFLDMTPEHLSRCESGAKVMSGGSEKILRLFACIATEFKNPEDLLVKKWESAMKKESKPEPKADEFVQAFLTMRIQSVFDSGKELHFTFVRGHEEVWEAPAKAA